MPRKQEHRTKLNGRVRIKEEVTHMYPNARVYNEGFVRKQIHDEHGYPLIAVEWDKDHWAYSGERDLVVLEAHFDPVEENMAEDDKNSDLVAALSEFLKNWQGSDNPGPEETKPESDDDRPTEELDYEKTLIKAIEDARNGEAFIVLVAVQEEFKGMDLTLPHVYIHSKSNEAAIMLDAAVSDYIAQVMARMAQEQIRAIRDGA